MDAASALKEQMWFVSQTNTDENTDTVPLPHPVASSEGFEA